MGVAKRIESLLKNFFCDGVGEGKQEKPSASLFRLSRYTNSLVERLVVHSSFPMSWDFEFKRNLNDQEIEEFA